MALSDGIGSFVTGRTSRMFQGVSCGVERSLVSVDAAVAPGGHFAVVARRLDDTPVNKISSNQHVISYHSLIFWDKGYLQPVGKENYEAELISIPALAEDGSLFLACISPNIEPDGTMQIVKLDRRGKILKRFDLSKLKGADLDHVVYDSTVISPDGSYMGLNFCRSKDVMKQAKLPQFSFFFDLRAGRFWSDRGRWENYSLDRQGRLVDLSGRGLDLKQKLEINGISLD